MRNAALLNTTKTRNRAFFSHPKTIMNFNYELLFIRNCCANRCLSIQKRPVALKSSNFSQDGVSIFCAFR